MKSCLIVDDSKITRMVAKQLLYALGFVSEEAADGQEALAFCQQQMPDAILLDWNMPNMNGIDFLRALRRLPGGDKPKIVFCTSEDDDEHIQSAVAAGANEFITKPFDKEIFRTKFAQVGIL
jgi:two-component system chemotaxis response regulator CheY